MDSTRRSSRQVVFLIFKTRRLWFVIRKINLKSIGQNNLLIRDYFKKIYLQTHCCCLLIVTDSIICIWVWLFGVMEFRLKLADHSSHSKQKLETF